MPRPIHLQGTWDRPNTSLDFFFTKEKSLTPTGIRTPDLSPRNQFNILL